MATTKGTTIYLRVLKSRVPGGFEVMDVRAKTHTRLFDLNIEAGVHDPRTGRGHPVRDLTAGQYLAAYGWPVFFRRRDAWVDHERTNAGAHAKYGNMADVREKRKMDQYHKARERIHSSGGPSATGPRPPKQRRKKAVSADAVISQLKDEVEKISGEKDAAVEIVEEKKTEERAAERAASTRCASLSMPMTVAFHCGFPSDILGAWYEVRRSFDQLTPWPFPHRKVFASLLLTSDAGDHVLQPYTADLSRPKGDYHCAQYAVTVYSADHTGYRMVSQSIVPLSTEQFLLARTRRIATISPPNLMMTLNSVRSFRSMRCNFPTMDYDPHHNTLLSDELFAALLLVDYSDLENVENLWSSMILKEAVLNTHRRVLRNTAAPMVEGCYVEGYQTYFSDLYPQVRDAALRAARSCIHKARLGGQVCTQCAHNAAQGIQAQVQRGDTFVRSCRTKMGSATRSVEAKCTELKEMCAARASPIHIRGLFPIFPSFGSARNEVVAAVKRLCPTRRPASAVAVETEAAAANALADEVRERCASCPDIEPQTVLDAAIEVARERPWTATQRAEFVCGVEMVVLEDATPLPHLATNGGFAKKEEYGGEVKAVRFISAPPHFVRGIQFGVYSAACTNFCHAMKDDLIKGVKSTSEMLARLRDKMGECMVIESDFSSFESQVCARRRELQDKVLGAACPPSFHGRFNAIVEQMQRDFQSSEVRTQHLVINPGSIRASGEYVTSVGNAIVNMIISFAAIARERGQTAAEQVRDLVRRREKVRLFVEGDDALISVESAAQARRLTGEFEAAGCKVTQKPERELEDASFCGARMCKQMDGEDVILKDPLPILSKLFYSMDPDPTTGKRDAQLMVARAMGYLMLYHRLPLVGPICRAVIKRYPTEKLKIEEAVIGSYPTPANVLLKNMLRDRYEPFKTFVTSTESVPMYENDETFIARAWRKLKGCWPRRRARTQLDRIVEDSTPIDANVREAVADMVAGLTPEEQSTSEAEITSQIRSGASEIEAPRLVQLWSNREGYKRMIERQLESRRDQMKAAGEAVAAKCTAAKLALLSGWSRFIKAGLAMLGCLIATITVLSTYSTLGLFSVLAGTASVLLSVLALFGVGFLLLWLIYGLPRTVAWRCMNAVAWIFTGAILYSMRGFFARIISSADADDPGGEEPHGCAGGTRTSSSQAPSPTQEELEAIIHTSGPSSRPIPLPGDCGPAVAAKVGEAKKKLTAAKEMAISFKRLFSK